MLDEIEMEEMSRSIIVRGPMTDVGKIIAALVIRLGGDVTLTQTEYEAAEGLMFWSDGDGTHFAANTDPTPSVLDSIILE